MKDYDEKSGISISYLNIQSGRAVRLEEALHILNQGNLYAGVLQETNITKGIHTRYGTGYTCMVDKGIEQVLEGSCVGLERGSGMEGGGHHQL